MANPTSSYLPFIDIESIPGPSDDLLNLLGHDYDYKQDRYPGDPVRGLEELLAALKNFARDGGQATEGPYASNCGLRMEASVSRMRLQFALENAIATYNGVKFERIRQQTTFAEADKLFISTSMRDPHLRSLGSPPWPRIDTYGLFKAMDPDYISAVRNCSNLPTRSKHKDTVRNGKLRQFYWDNGKHAVAGKVEELQAYMSNRQDVFFLAPCCSDHTLTWFIPPLDWMLHNPHHFTTVDSMGSGICKPRMIVLLPTRLRLIQVGNLVHNTLTTLHMHTTRSKAGVRVAVVHGGMSREEQLAELLCANIALCTPRQLRCLVSEGLFDFSELNFYGARPRSSSFQRCFQQRR
ncbi:hypothetical protein BU16DRAFT_211622 [Lophium mytilinum]|uniref:Uncharacterized protein n=1 Tax=Lophium mytilinum TaxID=390894 RepID=A0A6A6RAP1_9PEZI|nr:hypothetical protein BU16DRAFT_211622 [Lophium mytilinum]